MKAGHDQTQIAKLLDRHKSTISRELIRNTGTRGYRPKQACEFSAERAQNSRNAPTVELRCLYFISNNDTPGQEALNAKHPQSPNH
jgi:IS30 family transposase